MDSSLLVPYLVIELAHQLEVLLAALREDHPVPLLGHQEAERQGQLVVQERVLQPLGRLLGVPDLAEVASLGRGPGQPVRTTLPTLPHPPSTSNSRLPMGS